MDGAFFSGVSYAYLFELADARVPRPARGRDAAQRGRNYSPAES